MLKETDFKWHVRHANNIAENPIDCHYCIIDRGNGVGEMYVVKPLYAQNVEGWTRPDRYKYFVFLSCTVRLASAREQIYPDSMMLYSGYCKTSETLIAVFDTLEEAKKRAYTQYAHHFGYVTPHIVDNIDVEIRKHFVVGD